MGELMIVECVKVEVDESSRMLINRQMFGPFASFDEAHAFREACADPTWFDSILIHALEAATERTAYNLREYGQPNTPEGMVSDGL